MYYLYRDECSGEEFYVLANTFERAQEIAETYFEEPVYLAPYTEEEAEWFPLDVY